MARLVGLTVDEKPAVKKAEKPVEETAAEVEKPAPKRTAKKS